MTTYFSSRIQKTLWAVLVTIVVGISVVAIFNTQFNFQAYVANLLWHQFGIPVPPEKVTSPKLAFEIGNAYFIEAKPGNYNLNKASNYYKRAIEINPYFKDPFFQLGRIEFINARFWSAIDNFNKALSLSKNADDPIHSSTYYMRGLTYGYMRMFNKSEKDFLQILSWHSDAADSSYETWAVLADLAWVYFQQGKFKEVLNVTEEGLKDAPNNPWLLTNNGLALLNLGRKDEARSVLEKARTEAIKVTAEEWSEAYPGNNPQDAPTGLQNMIETIESNLALIVDN